MGPTDRFTPEEVQRIVGLTEKQLDYWDRLRLVSPQRAHEQKAREQKVIAPKERSHRFYNFRDLISLRTLKKLVEEGIPANRVRRSLAALEEKLAQAPASLSELRVLCDGGEVIVERGGARLEPISGQFVLNFDTRELRDSVRVMTGKPAEHCAATALGYESGEMSRAQAIEAYERAFHAGQGSTDTLIDCGTLYYEEGNLEKAAECFRQTLLLDPENALAHFNLGSVLDESGYVDAARQHLRQAVRLNPIYPDAHYNLAFVCEKLKAYAEAHQHWQAYVRLDSSGPWSSFARERAAATEPVNTITAKPTAPAGASKSHTTGK